MSAGSEIIRSPIYPSFDQCATGREQYDANPVVSHHNVSLSDDQAFFRTVAVGPMLLLLTVAVLVVLGLVPY
jgi:hypothetical protein